MITVLFYVALLTVYCTSRPAPVNLTCKAVYVICFYFFMKFGRNSMTDNIKMEKLEAVSKLYGPYIYRVCLRILGNRADAEDAAQDTYIKILDYMDRIEDIGSNSAKKYVELTAESVAKNMLAREKRKRPADMVRIDDEAAVTALDAERARTSAEEDHARDNCEERLHRYMTVLSDTERKMLEYHAVEKRTLKETAEHFGVRPDTFRKRMQRIREKAAAIRSASEN